MENTEKREMMEKMWKYRKNVFVQIFRFIVLGIKFSKLVKKAH